MTMPTVDSTRIHAHVERLGALHPPVDPGGADYGMRDARAVRERFARPLEYMARVEMEVERNVLELAVLLPGVSETDRLFYADVWGPQEKNHGLLLDTLGQHLGLPPAVADLDGVPPRIRVLGALAHIPAVHEVVRLLYYLTGAATEKSAMMAYQAISDGLAEMGEDAVRTTVIDAIKVQEPGHFAFYRLSALELVQSGALAPWQLNLARFLRSKSFGLVGAKTREERTAFGSVLVELGLDQDLERNVRDIVRVETQLLADADQGLAVPVYALSAFRDAAELYRELAGAGAGRRLVAA
jgi:hypothetical protein